MFGFKTSVEKKQGGAEGEEVQKAKEEHASRDPAAPDIVPRTKEATTPDEFRALLGGNKSISNVAIYKGGKEENMEIRTTAAIDQGGVSRFSIEGKDAEEFEQIAKDAGFVRQNPASITSVIMMRRR